MSKIMQGKWNHSKKPSEYEVFDSDEIHGGKKWK